MRRIAGKQCGPTPPERLALAGHCTTAMTPQRATLDAALFEHMPGMIELPSSRQRPKYGVAAPDVHTLAMVRPEVECVTV